MTHHIQSDRFTINHMTIYDSSSDLMWCKDANVSEFPLLWQEALDFARQLNDSAYAGYTDWRLPNRRELFSLIDCSRINPALPKSHPFVNVFNGYYWTSTTCARLPREAWHIHLGGGRVVKGMKQNAYMVWPVRSNSLKKEQLPRTGQKSCFNTIGVQIPCAGTGQDGEMQNGSCWPESRFAHYDNLILDNLSALVWMKSASCVEQSTDWQSAHAIIDDLNQKNQYGYQDWRLPTIKELECLTDMERHTPALPDHHLFENVQLWYWSSTTSPYDARYAFALYIEDGAIGVGYKPGREFFVWPVRGCNNIGEIPD